MEIESDSVISFLHVLIIPKGTTLATKVERKLTYTGRYLSFKPNYLLHVKRDSIQTFRNRASIIAKNDKKCLLKFVN
jgi:hypothetical protein